MWAPRGATAVRRSRLPRARPLCAAARAPPPLVAVAAAGAPPAWALGRRQFAGLAAAPLDGQIDRFGGVSVDLAAEDAQDHGQLAARLHASVAAWRAAGRCAAWVRVPPGAYAAVPALVEAGFDWHHAKAAAGGEVGYALLVMWLAEGEKSRIPSYPTTQIGVGGLVLSGDSRVLLVQEASARAPRKWKLPGGLMDPGEDLVDAVAREVFEETGVRAEAEGVLCIHHRHGYRHGVSDMYLTMQMRADSLEVKPCASEIHDVTWMPLAEAVESPDVMEFNRRLLRLAIAPSPLLMPSFGRHGSASAKADFFVYTPSAAAMEPKSE